MPYMGRFPQCGRPPLGGYSLVLMNPGVPFFQALLKGGRYFGYTVNSSTLVSHTIHVWYIYLHLVDFWGKCRYIIYAIHGWYGVVKVIHVLRSEILPPLGPCKYNNILNPSFFHIFSRLNRRSSSPSTPFSRVCDERPPEKTGITQN